MWFKKKKQLEPCVHTELGTFTFHGNGWMTGIGEDELTIIIDGAEFDVAILEPASLVLRDLDAYVMAALGHARASGRELGIENIKQLPEAIDLTGILQNLFGLTFGVSDNPDFTITIEFVDGTPVNIWGAD